MGIITCFQDRPLVVMLSLSSALLLEPLITFWMESIFLLGRLGNVFLIFKVFITMLENLLLEWGLGVEACAYNFFVVGFLVFLKNLEISLTSLGDLARIGGGINETKVSLGISLPLFEVWGTLTWLCFLRLCCFRQQIIHPNTNHKLKRWISKWIYPCQKDPWNC